MPRIRSPRRADERQLSLPFSWLSEDAFADALHERGARSIRQVRFKQNRTRMISLSEDREKLNVHTCFRSATSDVLDAVAVFVRVPPRTSQFREAVSRMRSWWDGQVAEDPPDPDSLRPRPCCATTGQMAVMRRIYDRLNREKFASRLPSDITLRLSDRMSRRLGHVQYAQSRQARFIDEIALNVDLMIPGNEMHLVDTMLHEMAHVEAWLRHGHREHGEPWKAIARRVGCEDRACTHVRIRRRRNGKPVTTVPKVRIS